jgi:MerR HTH family regulatory protein
MSEDLMDEGAQRLFPWIHERNVRAASSFAPGTSRPRTPTSTSGDVPGRTLPDRSKLPTRDDHSPIWAKHPKYIGNHPEPLYPIGALAKALGRDSNTMRAWITNGWLPEAQYRKKTPDVRGRRRYYTRSQIEGLVRIAGEEGLLNSRRRSPGQTRFPQRARALFDQLAAQARARRTA